MIENDLREMFRDRADQSDVPVPGRMTRIRERAAAQRRRRARAIVTVVVLACVGIATAPLINALSTDPDPAKRSHGIERFPDSVDGDARIASVMGENGEERATLTFTPDDTNFLVDFECADRSAPGLWRAASVNGHRVDGCIPGTLAATTTVLKPFNVGGVGTEDQVSSYWRRHGVVAGEPVTIALRLRGSGDAARAFDGRLGVGVYDMTGERTDARGIALQEQRTVDGLTYELAEDGYAVAEPSEYDARTVIPHLPDPALVVYGRSIGRTVLGGAMQVTVDGERGVLQDPSGVWAEVLPDGTRHSVVVDGSEVESGTVFVAYYTRAAD